MSRLLLSALVVLGVGCASTREAGQAGSQALRLGPDDLEPLRVEGRDITGPSTSLALKDNTLSGVLGGAATTLEWTPEQLSGVVGGAVARLEYTTQEDATLIRGTFGGAPVDLRLKGPWLTGRFRECFYDTEQTSEGFVGVRTCTGRRDEQMRVSFPEALGQRPALEQRALLAVALAVDSYRSYASPRSNVFRSAQPYSIIPPPTQRTEAGGMRVPTQGQN